MTRIIPIIVVLCSIGCAKHRTTQALEMHPSAWWQSTGSPCTDALQINTVAEGCSTVNTSIINNTWLELRCEDEIEGPWSQSWWLFTPAGIEPLPGYTPVCVDPSGTLSIRDQ